MHDSQKATYKLRAGNIYILTKQSKFFWFS